MTPVNITVLQINIRTQDPSNVAAPFGDAEKERRE
jgi:hypothetical protein